MSKQNDNVFLKIKGKYGKTWRMPCGRMSFDDMHKTYEEISKDFITQRSTAHCACILSAQITNTSKEIKSFKGTKHKDSYKFEIMLENPRLCVPCGKVLISKKDCLECIASGKCCDEFTINSIGKRLFPTKYTEKQK